VIALVALLACSEPPPAPEPNPEPAVEVPVREVGLRTLKADAKRLPGRFRGRADGVQTPDAVQAELEALGYLSGTNPIPAERGVRVLDRTRIAPGANLYVSGQGPEAHLIDVDGTVLHKWAYDWFTQWPDERVDPEGEFPNHWRRAHLFPNGDLLVIWGGHGMALIDARSGFRWGLNTEHIHHDADVDANGDIWTLTRRSKVAPELSDKRPVILDDILVYDRHGTVKRRIEILEAFRKSRFAPLIARWPTTGDVLHTNTISILRGGDPRPEFKDGHLLVSFRRTDTIAVIDPVKEEVVWALTGQWRAQHQPVLLDDGNLLIFDNRGLGERSRVLELDPFSQRVTWQYGAGEGEQFYSKILGSVQRLPNGNTLITESDNGRAFEVTRQGERVWEFVVPHTAGPNDEFVASLYELVRLPPDADLSWADPTSAERTVKAGSEGPTL
jgi:hypothetical protein